MTNINSESVVSLTSTTTSVCTTISTSVTPSNPVPTNMLSFRFATPNNTQTPYYISSDIVLSGGIAQQNRRRIVHNEVEKRRKDKITNWIKKLAELLPKHRVLKQSKNNVLESACEYVTELREMSSQFGSMKLTKKKLEQEVAELKNKINKLEEENKRLSELIHQNNISIPTTWSDSSVITATMRATSLPRNICTQQTTDNIQSTNVTWVSLPTSCQNSTDMVDTTTNVTTSTTADRLSVASILSNTQSTPTVPGPVAIVTSAAPNRLAPISTITNTSLPTTVLAVTWPNVSGNDKPTAQLNINNHSTTALATGINLQPLVVAQIQPSNYNTTVSNLPSGCVGQYHQSSVTNQPAFSSGTNMRTNRGSSETISQLPYSIEALTGNQTTMNRNQSQAISHISSFSAESLLNRHENSTNDEMVVVTNQNQQPVIQNTFTLTHPATLTNPTTQNSAPPQTFSNFSALSLVGNSTVFSASAGNNTPAPRSETETATPQNTHQIFTDFSTESLIGSNEFSSDFAIDNLISRSDSNVHMTAVNPNLIQSFGKGNDPMISSVCGDYCPQSSLHETQNMGANYVPFTTAAVTGTRHTTDVTNVPMYPTFSTILSPPLFTRSHDTTSATQRNANNTNFFSATFPTTFQVS